MHRIKPVLNAAVGSMPPKRARMLAGAALACAVAAGVLSGCGKSDTPRAPTAAAAPSNTALIGQFREPNGSLVTFGAEGLYRGTAGASGHFILEGNALQLTTDGGKLIKGERESADVVRLDAKPGVSLRYYRVGSAAAQSKAAQTRVEAPAAPAAPAPPILKPDPDVPLSQYTLLTEPSELNFIAAAYFDRPLTPEEKLGLLPPGKVTNDAFERRALAEKEAPTLDAQIEERKHQRYYRVDVSNTSINTVPMAISLPPFFWPESEDRRQLKAYDFNRQGFPMECIFHVASFGGNRRGLESGTVWMAAPPVFASNCLLPVPDVEMAKRIERARQKHRIAYRGSMYFFVTDVSSVGRTSMMHADLTHVDLTVIDEWPTPAQDLGTVSIDFKWP